MKKKDYLFWFLFIINILSIFLVSIPIISLLLSLLSLIFICIFFRNKKRYKIFIIILSIATIITSSTILYKKYSNEFDINKNKNILIGTWEYNDYGGTYVFKKDNKYIQYANKNKDDNYCVGKYKYSYGGTGRDGTIIKKDDNYYYYDLNLKEDYCIILGKEDFTKAQKNMVFAYSYKNKNNLLINVKSENISILKNKNTSNK